MKTRNRLLKTLLLLIAFAILCANLAACGGPAGKTYKFKFSSRGDGETILCGDKSYNDITLTKDIFVIKFKKDQSLTISIQKDLLSSKKEVWMGSWYWDKEDPTRIYWTTTKSTELTESTETYEARIVDDLLIVGFEADDFVFVLQQS